jgi:hypothetical protein
MTVLTRLRDWLAAPRAGHEQDGIHDLDVTRAPAEMGVNRAGNGLPGRVGIPVQQVLGPERDARDAVAALDAGRRDERPGEEVPVGGGEAFERQDLDRKSVV